MIQPYRTDVSRLHAYLAVPLPGLGLIASGRWWGCAVLTIAAGGLAVAVVPEMPLFWRIVGILGWSVAATVAVVAQWSVGRRSRPDPVRVKALARTTSADWIAGRDPLPALRLLLRAAPDEMGAWDLAARIATQRSETRLLATARRRMAMIAAR